MRFLRFALLQTYISSIRKNKKKALAFINTGIFLSVFAFTSAGISFYIEKKISDIQNELTILQIDVRDGNKSISDLENELNNIKSSLSKESFSTAKNRFVDEFKIMNKVITARDYYGSYIYFNLFMLKQEIQQMKEFYGINVFDKNDPFYSEIILALEESWDKKDVKKFTKSLNNIDNYVKKISKIDFEQYILREPLSLEEIVEETKKNSLNSLNETSQILDDYILTYDAFDEFTIFFDELLNVLKGGMARNRELVDQYSDDMLYYSNLERKVILSTFIFQFIIFVIIQVFELNSINFNLKKRLNEKKIY